MMRPFTSSTNPVRVPKENRLVIETISLQVDVTAGHHIGAMIMYQCDGNPTNLFFPITLAYRETSGFDIYRGLQEVALYADPDSSVWLEVYSPDGETGTSFLTLSGSLTDI